MQLVIDLVDINIILFVYKTRKKSISHFRLRVNFEYKPKEN